MRTSPVVAALLCVTACGLAPISQEQFLHSLTVKPSGKPVQLTVLPGKLEIAPNITFADQIKLILASQEWAQKKRVLIFVHGGLNSLSDGLDRTALLVPAITGDTDGETYPIMVNWESDLFDAYGDHLLHYHNGERKPDFWRALASPFILLADAGRAVSRLPIVYWDQGYAAARRGLFGVDDRPLPDNISEWSERIRMHPDDPQWSLRDTILDGVMQVFPGVLRVVTTPLIDTIGFQGYDILQRRIDTLFFTDDELQGRNTGQRGVLLELMSQIAAQDARTNQKTEIVLIGHSMGTIVLNELIRRFPTHNYTHIVYMAAACTIKDFVDAVPDYVTHNESVKFYSLCLHPSADAGEITAWGTVPNGSLLEWLDAYVLGPRTQMHRTLGKWNNAVPMVPLLNDLPPRVRNAIHMKGFTVLEDKYPCTHGSFDDYRFWHQDFWNPQHLQPVETVEQVLARVRGG